MPKGRLSLTSSVISCSKIKQDVIDNDQKNSWLIETFTSVVYTQTMPVWLLAIAQQCSDLPRELNPLCWQAVEHRTQTTQTRTRARTSPLRSTKTQDVAASISLWPSPRVFIEAAAGRPGDSNTTDCPLSTSDDVFGNSISVEGPDPERIKLTPDYPRLRLVTLLAMSTSFFLWTQVF